MNPPSTPRSTWRLLALAGGAGVVAFVVTLYAFAGVGGRMVQGVRFNKTVTAGQALTAEDLEPFSVAVAAADWTHTFVPWELVDSVLHRPLRRPMQAGTMLRWDDLNDAIDRVELADDEALISLGVESVLQDLSGFRVGDGATFDITLNSAAGKTNQRLNVGPFRVFHVSAASSTITVAVPWLKAGDPSAPLRLVAGRDSSQGRLNAVICSPAPMHRKPLSKRDK